MHCSVTATNKQSRIIDMEEVGHKLQQCKGVGACADPGDREFGVTADLFRLANLFRRNVYASGLVPVF